MLFPLWANPNNSLAVIEERFLAPEGVMAWSASNVNGRYPVPPGGGTLTRLEVMLGVAPGIGSSWTFAYYVNGVEIESTRVKIEGASTKGEWKGQIVLKEGDNFQIRVVGTGTPAAMGLGTAGTGFFTWVETVGPTFWIGGGGGGNMSTSEATHNPPFGLNTAGWGVEGVTRVVVPGKFKLRGVAMDLSGTPGTAKSYTIYARLNKKEDLLPVKVEGNVATSALAEGNVQLNPGDTWETKAVPAGTPTARTARYVYVIEAEVIGEMFACGMNEAADSTTTAQATYPDTWKSSWQASTVNRLPRPKNLTFKDLYIQIGVAPEAGKSRTYIMTMNGVSQSLKVKLEGAAVSGNDTSHLFVTDGTSLSLVAEPAGTPAVDTGGVHWGFVVLVPQTFPINQNTETDSARSMERLKTVTTGRSTETDLVLTPSRLKTISSGRALETDQARVIELAKLKAISSAQETDQAFPVTLRYPTIKLGSITVEIDTAVPSTVSKSRVLGLPFEIDQALSAQGEKLIYLGRASESDQALPVKPQVAIFESVLPTAAIFEVNSQTGVIVFDLVETGGEVIGALIQTGGEIDLSLRKGDLNSYLKQAVYGND